MSKNFFLFALSCLFVLYSNNIHAQNTQDTSLVVQFSGLILDGTQPNSLPPIIGANIAVKNRPRGTYTDAEGFFSIAVERTDTLVFSVIGFQTVELPVPQELHNARFSVVQSMVRDTIDLPEAVIFPWPSKEHFKLEFLAMDVSAELEMQERANDNLNEIKYILATADYGYSVDGATHLLQNQVRKATSIGQVQTMNIFNPLAWVAFFKSLKKNKRKKKRKSTKKTLKI